MGIPITDLPVHLQEAARRQMGQPGQPARIPAAPASKGTGPNKTELEAAILFTGHFTFEGRTFDVCGGARYTPDWVDLGNAVAIEAKGEHIHSRDSRRRFDEAVHLYPGWRWIWARKRTSGRKGLRWEVEIYEKR